MKLLFRVLLVIGALAGGQARSETSETIAIRAVFDRFVAAQNSHDIQAVAALLTDSPQFLWITRGDTIWGRAAALQRFEKAYAGTWHLEPEADAFQVVFSQPKAAQIFVPILFTIGPPGQAPQQTRFLMNQTLVKTANGWTIASILPIPASAPTQ